MNEEVAFSLCYSYTLGASWLDRLGWIVYGGLKQFCIMMEVVLGTYVFEFWVFFEEIIYLSGLCSMIEHLMLY